MVIDDGRIAECGSHDELMKLEGEYYNLYTSQYRFSGSGISNSAGSSANQQLRLRLFLQLVTMKN
jgi:hypothetical protein